MDVVLIAHLERVEEDGEKRFVWWGECSSVPGFSAAADHLPELIEQGTLALREILGADTGVTVHLEREPADRPDLEQVVRVRQPGEEPSVGNDVRQLVGT